MNVRLNLNSMPYVHGNEGYENKHAKGEVGILQEVLPPDVEPADRCFLYIVHEGSTHIGCLMIEDKAFCNQMVRVLTTRCNRSIAAIGSLDVRHIL
jgi:hypothetical protein